MISSGASVFMVSVKAIYTTAKLLPSVLAGGISGPAQEHAKATVWRYFKHPFEVMVFITFVSVIGLAIERLISRPLPAELGGTNPYAHILIMGGASMVALHMLRYIRADLAGHAPGRGIFGRAADVALGLSMHAALGGAGSAALGGARGLRGMFGSGGKTPWDQLDQQADAKPEEVLGEPQKGFDPVPIGTDAGAPGSAADSRAAGGGSGTRCRRAQQAIDAPDTSARGIDPLTGTAGVAAEALRPPERAQRQRRSRSDRPVPGATNTQPTLDAGSWDAAGSDSGSPGEVDPINTTTTPQGSDAWESVPPLSAYVDHTAADIPPPPEPPHDDPSAPPENPGPQATNVDPITGPSN